VDIVDEGSREVIAAREVQLCMFWQFKEMSAPADGLIRHAAGFLPAVGQPCVLDIPCG
jgi:hypothetical protein